MRVLHPGGPSLPAQTGLGKRVLDLTSHQDIWEDLVYSIQTVATGASGAQLVTNSGQSSNQLALEIDSGEFIYIVAQMSHTWVPNTVVYPHLHIEPQSNSQIDMDWIVKWSAADIGSDFPTDTTVSQSVSVAAGHQWEHTLLNVPSAGLDLSAFNGVSTVVRMEVELDATTEPIHIVSADIHYRWGGNPVEYSP